MSLSFHRVRARLAPLLALVLAAGAAFTPAGATPARAANEGAGWYDGLITYSTITNCVSIIQGNPYVEYGAGTYVGYYSDPAASVPQANQTWYLHVVMSGLGNMCSGQYAVPFLVLPASTTLAITPSTPVYCFAGGSPDTASCPQSLPFDAVGGGYRIKPTTQTMWPLPQGASWEFQVPVTSTTMLTGSTFGANVVMADGNANPTLTPRQSAYVFSAGATPKPAIVYPSPNTDSITRTSAISYANIYTAGLGGRIHFDLGTASGSYGLLNDIYDIPAGTTNWYLYDDWTPLVLTPDTTYHFRMWFDPAPVGGSDAVYGVDQTFRTLGTATTLGVNGLVGGQPGGTEQTVTITARDATGATSTTYRGTVHLSSTDTAAALPADYTFTAADAGVHSFPVRLMTAGTQSVTARDTKTASITGSQGGISVTTTVTPPTATITAQPANRVATSFAVSWNGASGAATYDVRYRRAAYNGAFGLPVTWKSNTAGTSATFSPAAGSTYCFSARSRATTGAVSPWTTETCTAVPLDDRSLTTSGSWTSGTGSSYYKGTYRKSTSLGAKLTRTGVQAKRIALVATTCATCGKVKVYWGSTYLKTISLYSSTTHNRRVIAVTTFADVRTGTLQLKVATSGKKVLIDGVILAR